MREYESFFAYFLFKESRSKVEVILGVVVADTLGDLLKGSHICRVLALRLLQRRRGTVVDGG